jgi:nucleolar MIF4G domain-containing protein 1
MSATDYKDAHNRISKLRLKKSQQLEIPRVLIHCASAEEDYNPFYSLISRRVCSERKLKMAFQFSLWNLFKRMGEDRENKQEDPDDDEDKDDELQLRSIVNLAKLFGALIAEDGLGIGVLKVKSMVQCHVNCTDY